ncbi:PSD1 and planctomycete cytochrome C domain-containing protein [Rhodopirellula sp.]|nr:PSD1 and planctomycete cytochrome C domain-containing protein [Rhodopirellula sp.]
MKKPLLPEITSSRENGRALHGLRLVQIMKTSLRVTIFLFVSVIFFSGSAHSQDSVDFSKEILPLLAENCFACHGFDAEAREADLRLDTVEGATGGKGGGGVIVAGDAEASALVERLRSDDPDLVMPPPETGKSLTADQKEKIIAWINSGASYDSHWAFVAPKRPELSSASQATNQENRHPIDQLVHRRLAEVNLSPAPLADPATLIRRVSLDLIGLPPTQVEVIEFEKAWAKDQEQAWGELVDRLLGSRHYGERWARWWLDQARYADSNGYSIDAPRSIWKYRDWVIDALNRDLSFDQFTIEQLAGDLLPNADTSQKVATGFHRNTQINQEGGIDKEQFRIDSIFDRVGTTGTVWLGLTVGCAQCHDHKFDPISQKEFYQFFAFFNNQDEPSIKVYPEGTDVDALESRRNQVQDQIKKLIDESADPLKQWEESLSDENKKSISDGVKKVLGKPLNKRGLEEKFSLLIEMNRLAQKSVQSFEAMQEEFLELSRQLNDVPTTMVLSERKEPRKTTVYIKGDFTRPSEEVTPGTLSILHGFETSSDSVTRLDLAKWIVDSRNPMTARVIVNRVWQQYFGVGMVATENDFGLVGARPTHPDLLDWLAVEWVEGGWSLKKLHRLIVTSDTYRQTSKMLDSMEPALAIDADNRLLWRQNRIRLDAELVRDVALTASGLMSSKQGGPPVFPPIPDGVMGQGQVKRSWSVSSGEDRYRRGLYTFVYRGTPPPSLKVFDAPEGFSSCTRRTRSNTPLQSLTLMNDSSFFEFAQSLAKIVEDEGVETAFQRCTSRRPNQVELDLLSGLDSLTVARALLNLDETITRE